MRRAGAVMCVQPVHTLRPVNAPMSSIRSFPKFLSEDGSVIAVAHLMESDWGGNRYDRERLEEDAVARIRPPRLQVARSTEASSASLGVHRSGRLALFMMNRDREGNTVDRNRAITCLDSSAEMCADE